MKPTPMVIKGDRVKTPDGTGTVKEITSPIPVQPTMKRFGIKLDKSTHSIPLNYYFGNEISKIK